MVFNFPKRIHLMASLVITIVGFILTVPLIVYGVIKGADVVWHLNWAENFAEQLWSGELYPRWLFKLNSGLGSPVFFFYPPIPYYITSLFYPFKFGTPPIWSALILSAALALIGSGFTAYFWLKDITNSKTALIGSVIYMAWPYHWAIDLYFRFAFAEYWSFVWLPLLLYFTRKIARGDNYSVLGFSLSYALLIMTHLPTILMFSAVPFFYLLTLSNASNRKPLLFRMGIAFMLGVGLSAIYLIPALTTQQYVSLNTVATGHFNYTSNFLLDLGNIQRSLLILSRFYYGILMLLMGCISYYAYRLAIPNNCEDRKEINFWLIITFISIFMMLPLSSPLWQVLPILQKIQFPWRFLTVLTISATALITLGFYFFNPRTTNFRKKLYLIHNILLVITLLSGFLVTFLTTERLTFDGQTQLYMSQETLEYRPQWVSSDIFVQYRVHELAQQLPKAKVTTGQGSVFIEQWQPRKIVVQVDAISNVLELTLKQFYYPGWTAQLEGKSNPLPVEPSSHEGLLRVKVPKGQHQVRISLQAGIPERLGQAISTFCALIVLLWALLLLKPMKWLG